jgi:hypothetical protein
MLAFFKSLPDYKVRVKLKYFEYYSMVKQAV